MTPDLVGVRDAARGDEELAGAQRDRLAGQVERQLAVADARERAAGELSHRAHLLEVNHTYAERMLSLQREWLEEAERVLSGGRSRLSRPPS